MAVMMQPVAQARIRWLTSDEGGRQAPPPGPVYAATARFAGDPLNEQFSVVLSFPQTNSSDPQWVQKGELKLLAPDRLPEVVSRLTPGTALLVHEGRRAVAACEIVSVEGQPWP
jgi:hypothetical protein